MNSETNQATSHELRVFAINGRVFRVDIAGVVHICTSRLLLIKLALFSAVVALFNPPMFGLELPFWGTFLYWLGLCYVVTGLWVVQFMLFVLLRRVTGHDLPMPAPVVVALALTGAVWLNYAVTETLFDLPHVSAAMVWWQVLRYFLISMVAELVTVLLVLPRFREVVFETPLPAQEAQILPKADKEQQTAASEPSQPMLVVNGRAVPLEWLRWMKSQEHYVEFHCDTDTVTERAPLRDMVLQASGVDGIQPHRSWWVSRRAVDRLARRGGNPVLILTDGTEVPISRHRKAQVEAWLAG